MLTYQNLLQNNYMKVLKDKAALMKSFFNKFSHVESPSTPCERLKIDHWSHSFLKKDLYSKELKITYNFILLSGGIKKF